MANVFKKYDTTPEEIIQFVNDNKINDEIELCIKYRDIHRIEITIRDAEKLMKVCEE